MKSRTEDPAARLRAAITSELHIDPGTEPVKVAVEDGTLVVEGMVGSIAKKKRAMLIAMGTPGVEGVVDRLRVRPAMPMSDAEIRDHFLLAVAEESTLSGAEITIEVKDGVVDIEGRVVSLTHKRLAGVFAWWVPGSAEVINSLEVEPPEEDTDDEVTDAVRIVLEKDRLVDEGSVRVSTRDWVVTLSGSVPSEAQRKTAEDDAWYVWGVNGVVNRLEVV